MIGRFGAKCSLRYTETHVHRAPFQPQVTRPGSLALASLASSRLTGALPGG
jgi:hypothetical protein